MGSQVSINIPHVDILNINNSKILQDNDSIKLLKSNQKILIQNTKSKLEESLWKNKIERRTRQENSVKNFAPLTCTLCCNLATKLLDNFDEKTPMFYQPYTNEILNKFSSQNFETCHNSNCYCLSLLNDEYKNKNEISKDKNHDHHISKCLDFTKKKTECYVCNRSN